MGRKIKDGGASADYSPTATAKAGQRARGQRGKMRGTGSAREGKGREIDAVVDDDEEGRDRMRRKTMKEGKKETVEEGGEDVCVGQRLV